MKKVFDASTGIEAYMIANLLEQNEIDAHVEGEYLQGGMGELPASGLVRVLVADADYDRSRSIIKTWDTQQATVTTPKNFAISKAIYTFIAGSVIGGIIVFWALNSPVTEDGKKTRQLSNLFCERS